MNDHQVSGEILQIGEHTYRIDQPAIGVVTRADASTIIVELPGHVRGIIPRESLPRELRFKRCDQIVSQGTEVEAVIRKIDRQKYHVFLSGLRIVRDPWKEVRPKLKIGSLVRGEIYNIEDYGVFVELDEGVAALIPVSEIPGGTRGSIGEVLAPGDLVEARVTAIDDEQREITASIQAQVDLLHDFREQARGKLEQEAGFAKALAERTAPAPAQVRPHLQGGKGNIQRILFVDDDVEFLTRYAGWLRRLGYEVETAITGEEGVERAVRESFDLILLDVNLPDIGGIKAVGQIKRERPAAVITIVTADDELVQSPELQELGLVGVVSKWSGFSGLEDLIGRLETGAFPRDNVPAYRAISQEVELLQKTAERESRRHDLGETLEQMLGDLLEATGAQTGVVFDMSPDTGQVAALAIAGVRPDEHYDAAKLRYSPVRDVIRTGVPVYDNHARDSGRRFSYLLRYLLFDSCIGLRIEVGQGLIPRYALFLFHHDADQFTDADFERALLVSKSMGLAIERQAVFEHEQTLQALAVAGLLHSGLLHEIRNLLEYVETAWRNLRLDYADMRADPQILASDGSFLERMERRVAGVVAASQRLRETADSYLGLLRKQQQGLLDVNNILQQARQVVALEAPGDVLINLRPGKDIPRTIGIESRLERAFVNVMLNAAQQMAEHSRDGGTLVAATFHDRKDATRPIKIRFIDTGPGIHRKDFEHIFERGVSHREGGSGLGLYITRGLIEAMGGRIRVEDSRMFVGSCFLIELPAAGEEVLNE